MRVIWEGKGREGRGGEQFKRSEGNDACACMCKQAFFIPFSLIHCFLFVCVWVCGVLGGRDGGREG